MAKKEKKIVYVVHPVTDEQKEKFVSTGVKIVDARFAPADAKKYTADGEEVGATKEPDTKEKATKAK